MQKQEKKYDHRKTARVKVQLTQAQIVRAINAFEEVNRVTHYLLEGEGFIKKRDIRNLKKEADKAWEVLTKAWGKQTFTEKTELKNK